METRVQSLIQSIYLDFIAIFLINEKKRILLNEIFLTDAQ